MMVMVSIFLFLFIMIMSLVEIIILDDFWTKNVVFFYLINCFNNLLLVYFFLTNKFPYIISIIFVLVILDMILVLSFLNGDWIFLMEDRENA